MKTLLVSLLMGLLIFSGLAKAESNIYQYGINAEIFANNSVYYNLSMVLINHSSQTFSIPLGQPDKVIIETPGCIEQKGNLETVVTCFLNSSSRSVININYFSNSVREKGGYLLFSDSFKIVNDTKILTVLIKLPEGSGLKQPTESSYIPQGALIGSDGRRPIINWVANDLEAGGRFEVSIAFERLTEENVFPLEMIVVVILIVFSGFAIFYRFYWRAKRVNIILPVLKKDEKMIFNIIMKSGSGVNQKVIVKESGYSKAKVSKVLSSLRERGLVKLERIGRSNKIYIEKKFETKAGK
ncbi:MAG: hypothetical protein V1678_05390 [Candidatus Aenigmatarchaeota archaeon]